MKEMKGVRRRLIRLSPWTEQNGTVTFWHLVIFNKWVFRIPNPRRDH